MPTTCTSKIPYAIRLDEKLYKRLNREAAKLGTSKSMIVHVALENLFKSKNLKIKLD